MGEEGQGGSMDDTTEGQRPNHRGIWAGWHRYATRESHATTEVSGPVGTDMQPESHMQPQRYLGRLAQICKQCEWPVK